MERLPESYARSSDGGAGNVQHNMRLSKALSYLLRHGAPKENITIHPGGFVDVDEMLKLKKFAGWSIKDVQTVVEDNDKQRFTLRTDSGKLQICANQGHSFPVEDPQLEEITDPSLYPTVIHGTYAKCFGSIKKNGLSKMNRTHIHFAPGEFGREGVISGMRASAEIYIYVNLEKALNDGLKFYKSRNNVILSPGNENGVLDTKYFRKAVNIKTKQTLLE